MHILIGALVGAVFAVGMMVGMSLLTGRKPIWKHVALAALGGAVGGAVASATLGAGGFAGAALGRQVVGMGLGGATGGASERVAENLVDGRPVHEGLARSTAVGGVTGVVGLGVTRTNGAVLARLFPNLAASPAVSTGVRGFIRRAMASPTPGTGRGFLRGLESRREACERARRADEARQAADDAAVDAGAKDEDAPAEEEPPAHDPTPGLTGVLGGAVATR